MILTIELSTISDIITHVVILYLDFSEEGIFLEAQVTMNEKKMFTTQQIIHLIIPIIFEQLLLIGVGVADTVMVSGVGMEAVSAVSLVDAIFALFATIYVAIATGGAVVATHYIGQKDFNGGSETVKQLIYLAFFSACVIMALSLAFNYDIIHIAFGNIAPGVMSNSRKYFYITAVSFPFIAIYNAGAALFRAQGKSKTSLIVSLAMNAINITGNAILIYGFHMGVVGAAIPTLVSRAFAGIVMAFLIAKKKNIIRLDNPFKYKFSGSICKNILRIGIPNSIENSMFLVGRLLFQTIVATFGTAAIAANAVANNVYMFNLVPGTAIGMGMMVIVGQCMGAKEYEQAVYFSKKLLKYSYIALSSLSVVMFVFSPQLASMFNLSAEGALEAVKLLRIATGSAALFWPLGFALPNALRAAGDVRYTMVVSIACMWIFRIGLGYLLAIPFGVGVAGVWYGMTVDWIFRGGLILWRYKSRKWLNQKVIG